MEIVLRKPLKKVWLKASVVGSTWASVEIILGSFLHNLKIPLAGTILSFISVWILISFLQIWKEKGLALRAGIICALLKSISPSAIILGPMIGIFTEAILVELFILLFGKNLIAYMLGGALAVLSSLLHKAISLLILYGFDLVKILSDLYNYAMKQVRMEGLSPAYFLLVVAAIYMLTGMAGAVAGYISGRKYLKRKVVMGHNGTLNFQPGKISADESHRESYSILLFIFHLCALIIVLLLINSKFMIPAAIVSCAYVVFCILKYRNSLRRLKKVYFWLSFLLITFAAAFLWNGFSNGAFFTLNGLMIGLKMNVRAIIIVLGFAAISVELKNPVIKSLLYSKGLANLYQSTNLAFAALPFFISNVSKSPGKDKPPKLIAFNNIFALAESLLSVMEKEEQNKPGIVIITGPVHSGKTTLAKAIVSRLTSEKIKVAGFLSIAHFGEGICKGYDLLDIESPESIKLCDHDPVTGDLTIGPYHFSEEAILKGEKLLSPEYLADKQLAVIDEIGRLELANKGWSSAIENISHQTSIPQLWIVRQNIVRKVIRRWNTGDVFIFETGKDTESEISQKISELIGRNSTINPS
jgi:nucleoside-triphosphatase THEP1